MAGSAGDFAAGATFGAALLLSGVYAPAVITSQLSLSNFHMLEAFLAASAGSAAAVAIADRAGWAPVSVRAPRNLRLDTGIPYSANLIGGAMLGAGMALTGACPGTVLVQIATGVPTGIYVAAGGLLGALAFNLMQPVKVAPGLPSKQETVQAKMHVSTETALLVYEAMCAAMLFASTQFAPKTTRSFLPPVLGGAFIGTAQALTLFLTRRTVGVSGAYGDVASYVTDALNPNSKKKVTIAGLFSPSVVFAIGILAGSAILARNPNVAVPLPAGLGPSATRAFLGGVLGLFGARMAGGCTSGHGISGMATFSVASFLTVAAMFGGGIATAKALGM